MRQFGDLTTNLPTTAGSIISWFIIDGVTVVIITLSCFWIFVPLSRVGLFCNRSFCGYFASL